MVEGGCGYLPVIQDGLFEGGKVRETQQHVEECFINLFLALSGRGVGREGRSHTGYLCTQYHSLEGELEASHCEPRHPLQELALNVLLNNVRLHVGQERERGVCVRVRTVWA